jgi:ADP-ribose pyrophosphatase YjhB (NUDIX family)
MTEEPGWLQLGRELRAIAQTGLAYCTDVFGRQRYERIYEVAALLMARESGADPQTMLSVFMEGAGYATPKVGVRGAVFRDSRVLMVRETSDGGWALPGGWADVTQSAAECVVREVAEESGFQCRAVKLVAAYDYKKHFSVSRLEAIYNLYFLCELTGGAARPSVETSEVDFFALDALPPLSPGRATAAQIELMFRHFEHPELPTEFD